MKPRLKVYIAAPWIRGGEANKLKKVLTAKGYYITAGWLQRSRKNLDQNYDYNKDPAYKKVECCVEAERDIQDIERSDVVVVLNGYKSEGKVVEQGLALAMKIPIIIFGPKTNIFQNLPSPTMKVVKSEKALLLYLKKLRKVKFGKGWSNRF